MKKQNRKSKIIFFILNAFILLISFKLSTSQQNDDRTKGVNENCLAISEYDLFDLFELESKERRLQQDGNIIYVNFCKNFGNYSSSVVYKNSTGEVILLAGNINGEKDSKNKVNVVNNNVDKNEGNLTTKVILHLARGQKCISDRQKYYDFSIVLTCQNNVEYIDEKISSFNPYNTCSFVMEAKTKHACGKIDQYEIAKILGEHNIKIGIILCILGSLLALFGYKYIKYAIFVECIIVFPVVGFYLFIGILGINNDIVLYVVIFVFLICGIGIAFLITRKHKYLKFYMFIVGGGFGVLIGYLIFYLIISLLETSLQKIIFFAIIITGGAAGVFLGIFAPKFACIVGSSTLGGYALMRGISLFFDSINKYIDEYQIFDYARTGNYEKIGEMINGWFYVYPTIFIIFSVAFTYIQYKLNPKQDDVDDYKELEGKFEQSQILNDFKGDSSLDPETFEEDVIGDTK